MIFDQEVHIYFGDDRTEGSIVIRRKEWSLFATSSSSISWGLFQFFMFFLLERYRKWMSLLVLNLAKVGRRIGKSSCLFSPCNTKGACEICTVDKNNNDNGFTDRLCDTNLHEKELDHVDRAFSFSLSPTLYCMVRQLISTFDMNVYAFAATIIIPSPKR